jgi:DNA-binding response OmpR family regulator
MNPTTLLYAEDDETLAFLTIESLGRHYAVSHYNNGAHALAAYQQSAHDICVLDVSLPGIDGFALAAAIRQINEDVPIIFLSARSLKEDRLQGLRTGADDYLVKPFSMEELLLKLQIFLTRSKKNQPSMPTSTFAIGNFIFQPGNFTLTTSHQSITLTQRESELLQYMLHHKNQVLKREQILTAIWGQEDYFFGRSLDVFISRLRKIFATDSTVKIETLHGIGFKLVLGG